MLRNKEYSTYEMTLGWSIQLHRIGLKTLFLSTELEEMYLTPQDISYMSMTIEQELTGAAERRNRGYAIKK